MECIAERSSSLLDKRVGYERIAQPLRENNLCARLFNKIQNKSPLPGLAETHAKRVPSLFDFFQYRLNIEFQFGNIPLDHRSDRIGVNAKVMMDQNVPHSNNIRPGNVCMLRLKIIGERTAGLPNDSDMVNHQF